MHPENSAVLHRKMVQLLQARNALAPSFRRSKFAPDGRSCHVSLVAGENLFALRDQIVGRARGECLDREARIR